MSERRAQSYHVRSSDWGSVPGRGITVLVPAPFDRHAAGDVLTIYTSGFKEAPHKETAGHFTVTGREGSVGSTLTALIVRPAKLEEVHPPKPDPTTMTEGERLKEASRQASRILLDLAGCIGMDRNGVNRLREKVRRLDATIAGIEYEPDCDHRWDWPDGTTRHGRPPAS